MIGGRGKRERACCLTATEVSRPVRVGKKKDKKNKVFIQHQILAGETSHAKRLQAARTCSQLATSTHDYHRTMVVIVVEKYNEHLSFRACAKTLADSALCTSQTSFWANLNLPSPDSNGGPGYGTRQTQPPKAARRVVCGMLCTFCYCKTPWADRRSGNCLEYPRGGCCRALNSAALVYVRALPFVKSNTSTHV